VGACGRGEDINGWVGAGCEVVGDQANRRRGGNGREGGVRVGENDVGLKENRVEGRVRVPRGGIEHD